MRWMVLAAVMWSGAALAQEATLHRDVAAALVAERDRATSCASLLKQYAPEGSIALFDGQQAYGEGRAAAGALVTRLRVALVDGGPLDEAAARAEAEAIGVHAGAVCAARGVPAEGMKGIWDVLTEAVGPLLGYFGFDGDGRAERIEMIAGELDRGRWPAFGAVE